MRHFGIWTAAMAAVIVGTAACGEGEDDRSVTVTDTEKQEACASLSGAGSTAKLVQAGPSLGDPSDIDATGAARTVILKGEAPDKRGFLALNIDDAAFLLLLGADVPVTVVNASGALLPLADSHTSPSWCDAATQSLAWRAARGETSVIELGPTELDEVVLVVSHVDE